MRQTEQEDLGGIAAAQAKRSLIDHRPDTPANRRR